MLLLLLLLLLQNMVGSKSIPNRSELKFLFNLNKPQKTRRKDTFIFKKSLDGKEILNLKNDK